MPKTLGQIAREASDAFEESYDEADFLKMNELSWEAAAAAVRQQVIEECIRELCWDCSHGDVPKYDPDASWHLHEMEGQTPRGCAATELHSLKQRTPNAQLTVMKEKPWEERN